MTAVDHAHTWLKPIFRDFCHYTLIEAHCKDCPTVRTTKTERNFGLNPIQIAFADPACERCRELARGYEPDSWKTPVHREG